MRGKKIKYVHVYTWEYNVPGIRETGQVDDINAEKNTCVQRGDWAYLHHWAGDAHASSAMACLMSQPGLTEPTGIASARAEGGARSCSGQICGRAKAERLDRGTKGETTRSALTSKREE